MLTGQQGESQQGHDAGGIENEVEKAARSLLTQLLEKCRIKDLDHLPRGVMREAWKLHDALERLDESR